MRTENIDGVGVLNPDLHDPAIIYSEDYPILEDEFLDDYYLEAKYFEEEDTL